MKIKKSNFGSYESQTIELFELSNNNGMTVKIMNYGATITSITIPAKQGGVKEIACGFDKFESYFSDEYKANAPYFGCTVGRYCSQIKDAKFTMDGKEYKLAEMVGTNNLHGGLVGFDKKVWKAKEVGAAAVEMSLLSKDMEEGFPGDVEVTVTFTLTNDNEIKIDYKGVPNKKTPLAMTNHTYFNLSGFADDILGHKATVLTGKKQECDETGAGTGKVVNLDGAPDDLRKGKLIGEAHKAMGSGFENFYITEANFKLTKVAEVEYPADGTKLEVSTTEPTMLLYTGKYTADNLKRENGLQYGQYRGFCLETHRTQNGPNISGSPKTFTGAGETFESTTIFKLTF